MKYIDMHTHTTASDGNLSPSQLIDYAVAKGLNGIAITDHDSINGLEEAQLQSRKYHDFYFIPGIELSTVHHNEEVHILGYDINVESPQLFNILQKLQDARTERAGKIISKLQKLGFIISYEEVLERISTSGVIGRPHIANLLVEKKYIPSVSIAFEKYLNQGCPAYVSRYKLTPFEAVDIINRAGGQAVIAHPGLLKDLHILHDILESNIAGIEVYHSDHTTEHVSQFLDMAQKHNLGITGGSDFHCASSNIGMHGDLGSVKVPLENAKRLLSKRG
ncbi:PHP C-terminal domain protein [Alkaliphilus metalliredigens QYMF]|uniref:PHP C-terminal domain protein n=1 Tax=Alkaliphilus metalliredigens (strain QYMF) TaxID=293826 RepID=A6TRI9_ALKMQ|nr:PHP domain-containing protein [Alkaliphilus metalliredigens]ABR48807.1 PHP C-terminal domain protein [Alkaliphilus metalliredigens QYMF]